MECLGRLVAVHDPIYVCGSLGAGRWLAEGVTEGISLKGKEGCAGRRLCVCSLFIKELLALFGVCTGLVPRLYLSAFGGIG